MRVREGTASEGALPVEDLEGNVAPRVVASARGDRVDVARARGALTGSSVVARQALTLSLFSVAQTLVGALHVIVGGIGDDVPGGILHQRISFGRSVRVHGRTRQNNVVVVANRKR